MHCEKAQIKPIGENLIRWPAISFADRIIDRNDDVSRVAPIDKLSVVITIILAFVFLREQITLRELVASLLITAGSILLIMK